MRLTFDSDKHEYRLDGVRIPGTSEILRAAGLIGEDVLRIPEEYRIRGLAVHEWSEADDTRGLGRRPRVPPIIEPYLEAWRRFRRESGLRILAVEELVCDRLRRFATRVDRRVTMAGGEWILNLKSGHAYDHYPIQSALEAMCYRPGLRRASVYLSKDGKYQLCEYTETRHFRIAESAVRAYYRHPKLLKELQ